MIDTIRLGYRLCPELECALAQFESRFTKMSASGEIINDYIKPDARNLPSSFSGLWIGKVSTKKFNWRGHEFPIDWFVWEFSLHKCYDGNGYNDRNVRFADAMCNLMDWLRKFSRLLDFSFRLDEIKVFRCDLSENYDFTGHNCTVYDFIENIDYKASRVRESRDIQRYKSSVFYPSRWITKKIYVKYDEYKHLCKQGKKPLQLERVEKMKNMIRLEMEFRSEYLRQNHITKIYDLRKLRIEFQKEKNKLMTAKILSSDYDEYISQNKISHAENNLVTMVKELGYVKAKKTFIENYGERKFYRVKKSLQSKKIFIECVSMAVRREFRELLFDFQPSEYSIIP